MKQIELYLADNVWMAHYAGAYAAQVLDLFSTQDLPTRYTEKTPSLVVLDEIKKLNGDAIVSLRYRCYRLRDFCDAVWLQFTACTDNEALTIAQQLPERAGSATTLNDMQVFKTGNWRPVIA